MGTYRDSATVIVGDVEYEVDADLRSETGRIRSQSFGGPSVSKGLESWGGIIDARTDAAAWAIQAADEPRLRLPDGRDAGFRAVDNAKFPRLRIEGNGRAPF